MNESLMDRAFNEINLRLLFYMLFSPVYVQYNYMRVLCIICMGWDGRMNVFSNTSFLVFFFSSSSSFSVSIPFPVISELLGGTNTRRYG